MRHDCPLCAGPGLVSRDELTEVYDWRAMRKESPDIDAFIEGHGTYACALCYRIFDETLRQMTNHRGRTHNKRGARRGGV